MVYGENFKPLNWEIREIDLSIKPEQWDAQQKDGIAFHMEIDAPLGGMSTSARECMTQTQARLGRWRFR